ncbi:hypothetical protein LCGC14_2645070, partial [marine sediment metagenome]
DPGAEGHSPGAARARGIAADSGQRGRRVPGCAE